MLLSLLLIISSSFASTRLERHQEAVEAFEKLHFFHNGRGMAITPDLIKLYDVISERGVGTGNTGMINQRWGLQFRDNRAVGIFSVPYEGMQVGVLGCIACHSGKAAGEYIVGLGNKNIDVGQIGTDAYHGMKVWGALPRANPKFREVHNRALEFTKGLGDKTITNMTQGLVPTSLIRSWFYKVQNLPFPEGFPKGQVKIPHMWGYGEKRKTGSFWDGEGNGELGGWGAAVELYAGQTAEGVKEYFPKVLKAEEYLGEFLPPKYPFKIQTALVKRGEELYQKSCFSCHGEHVRDSEGLPIYTNVKHVPWRVVKTDRDRLNSLTEELYQLIERNPLNDIIQSVRKPEVGYVAPKLWGVWSRFPYLHNASVPTVWDLLSHPDQRPKVFSLKNAGERERFDEEKLGLTSVAVSAREKKSRRIFDTSREGHSNQGHYFKSFEAFGQEEKRAIVEYLKTL